MITANVIMWGTRIGAIVQDDPNSVCRFSYDRSFLNSGIEIAPLTMPLSNAVYYFPELEFRTFFGLPGLMADSLPDKYGTKVFERYLRDQGRDPQSITPIERLCYTGKRGMGALEYVPETEMELNDGSVDIGGLVSLASDILMEREQIHSSTMEHMISVGTSAGGARAKAVIAWNRETNDIRSGQIDAGKGYEYWLIKFDGVEGNRDHLEKNDGPQYTRIEYAYHQMAADAGIVMSPCLLYEEGGHKHFMTRRFDRGEKGEKIHMLSLEGMAHFDFNSPGQNSYEQVGDIIYRLGMGAGEAEQFFRRMVFNELARNYDDHVKNTAFLMNRAGEWSLSPAYDITYAYEKNNFWLRSHQMTIAGKREEITNEDMISAGLRMNLKKQKCKAVIEQIGDVVSNWKNYADEASVKRSDADMIDHVLNGRE